MTIAFVLLTLFDQARGQWRDLSRRIKQRAQKSDEKEKTVRTETESNHLCLASDIIKKIPEYDLGG